MTAPFALIIEDDLDLGTIFEAALDAAGFTVEVIRTGDAALARLRSVTPDVITLDLHLPGMSGEQVLQYIRSEPRLNSARVILTTADAAMADRLSEQADLVLVKPISFGQMRDLARRLVPAA